MARTGHGDYLPIVGQHDMQQGSVYISSATGEFGESLRARSSQPEHDPFVGLRLGKRFAQRHAIVLWRSVVKTRRGGLSSSLRIRRR